MEAIILRKKLTACFLLILVVVKKRQQKRWVGQREVRESDLKKAGIKRDVFNASQASAGYQFYLLMCTNPISPLLEQTPVKGSYGRALPKRLSPEIIFGEAAQVTPSLLQNEAARSIIPQLLAAVEVEVKAAGGGITPFKRTRTVISL